MWGVFDAYSLILLLTIIPQYCFAKTSKNTTNNKVQTVSKVNNIEEVSPILSNKVVIYNTHTSGKYSFGESIVDISKKMKDKFLEKGVNCIYLENKVDSTKHNYNDLFNISRNLIINNIPDYKDLVLLDIDVMLGYDNNIESQFRVSLSDYNKSFLDKMVRKYNPTLFKRPGEKLNQDLSSKQLYMIMGNEAKSKDEVYDNMDSLVNAITITLK